MEPSYRLAGKVVLSDGKPLPPKTRLYVGGDLAWDAQIVELGESGRFDLVCGDRDWQMAEDLLDQPPDVANRLKAHFGIDDGFFTAVVPLPKTAVLLRARQSLRNLVRARP